MAVARARGTLPCPRLPACPPQAHTWAAEQDPRLRSRAPGSGLLPGSLPPLGPPGAGSALYNSFSPGWPCRTPLVLDPSAQNTPSLRMGTAPHPIPTSTPRKLGWPPRCVLPRPPASSARPAPVPTPCREVCPSCADKPSPESPSPSPCSWLHRSPAPVPVVARTLHGKATEYLLVTTSQAFDTALDVTALLTAHAVPEPWTPSPEPPPCPSSVLQSCASCSRDSSTTQSPVLCSSSKSQSTVYSSVPSSLFTAL
ncbi:uncharacterized protein [Physeter macrocephalus]|uniref:Uncharacterized protein n=1 Tax=Physeter macrocephalus TaxID=9755 RepID=A0A455B317_PHYMC|nr:uncharacterized protein LOC114484702 [Physeter catodon]|eukprot:XP_028338426.1 proline-rich receptor-like protein kinase PERK2 [Physeter catodon]